MKFCFAVAIAILLSASMTPGPLHAKDTKVAAASCPKGFDACVKGCVKGGGQPRFCPDWCRKQKGC
jgi:hypothetical protein